MNSVEINNELVCVVASLGYKDGDEYFKSLDCFESLKDMIRFLKYEDKTCNVRRQMGCTEVLQNDLIPILINYQDEKDITDITVRLLVNLTTPADVCFQNKEEDVKPDGSRETQNLELLGYLQKYKEAFTHQAVMAAIGAHLAKILQLEWEERDEDHNLLLERLLLLLRNIFHVPSNPDNEQRTTDDVNVNDQLIWSCHLNGIDDLLLYIASSPTEAQWCMHAVEIVSLMLREQNPEKLASTGSTYTTSTRKKEISELAMMREAEALKKKASIKKLGTRHSRFRGSFWVENKTGIDRKSTLVYHKNVATSDDISFDFHKNPMKKRINHREVEDRNLERESTASIRLMLKEFCSNFVESCYNPLMNVIKDNIMHKKAQDNDESYYLWAMRFFMNFNRHHGFKVEYVRETLSVNIFQYILRQLFTYYDHMTTDKKDARIWAKRLHLALRCYQEVLMYVVTMEKSKNADVKDASKVMKSNIMYVEEYRDIFITLLRKFSVNVQPRSYLKDLIETFHVYMKMLDSYTKEKGVILVKKKKRRGKAKRSTTKKRPTVLNENQLEQLWQDDVSPVLSKLVQSDGSTLDVENASPFDATSDTTMDEQRELALLRIQAHLREKDCVKALSLLKASREVWPEEDHFGSQDFSSEDEFVLLKEIFSKQFPSELMALMNQNDSVTVPETPEIENEEINDEEEEEEEEENLISYGEKTFEFSSFLKRLLDARVLQPYCHLLKYFEQNASFTNHCIVKVLHRVTVSLKSPAMLFQLSLFRTFDRVLKFSGARQYQEVVDLAKFILSKFFRLLPERPMLVVETLFWKHGLDCYEIMEGYGSAAAHGIGKRREKWTYEEEEELKTVYDQFRGEEDPVQCILDNLTDKTRSRGQIVNKLVRLRLVESAKELPRPKAPKKPKWTEEQNEELKHIFQENKNADDPLGTICALLSFDKSKRKVSQQLFMLGLVQDRKELYKKRGKGKRKRNEFNEMLEELGESSDDDSDNERHDQDDQSENIPNGNEADNDDLDSSDIDIEDILDKVIKEDSVNQLDWLQSRLESVAVDRDEGESQPVPLVTVTTEQENAVSSPSFRRLLKGIGLRPPAADQESFWRIPETLSSSDLRRYFDDLSNASRRASLCNSSKSQSENGIMATDDLEKENENPRDVLPLHLDPPGEDSSLGNGQIMKRKHSRESSPGLVIDEDVGNEDESLPTLKRKKAKLIVSDDEDTDE